MQKLQKAKYFIAGMIVMSIIFTLVVSTYASSVYPPGTIDSPTNTPTKFRRDVRILYDDYKVYIDGELFQATDRNGVIMPFVLDGWIYAPFEHIAKALGQQVRWESSTNSLHITTTGQRTPTGGGTSSSRSYSFTVNNRSAYSIYSIHMGPASVEPGEDVDILPQILRPGESIVISGTVPSSTMPASWTETDEWTLFVTDTEDDTSARFDVFNPWTVRTVDIHWSNDPYGYRCTFTN